MMRAAPIVFIVDDDLSVRESLAELVRTEGLQVEAFASAREFLAHPRARGPSCLVLDLALPELDGLDLQKRVAAERADMPIIFITGYGDVRATVQAMKAGAVEFLTKPLCGDELLAAIHHALERSAATCQRDTELLALRASHAALSPREREVMSLVVSGLANKEIGEQLRISEVTVKAHRGRVMRKMNATSLADLVTKASTLGVGCDLASSPVSSVAPVRLVS
jgi:FixJ family two-component response regulator